MKITKEEFYRRRATSYPLRDFEALIRYQRALGWMEFVGKPVIREVGCKYAVVKDLLEKSPQGVDYVAIDIDESTLKKIPQYCPQQFIQHNANTGLPFNSAIADYILSLEVLEHLEDATSFFSEAHRVLKPSGSLIISVPNPYCWMEFLDNLRHATDTEGHIGSYTYQNMEALAKFTGFTIKEVQGTFTRVPFSKRLFGDYKLIVADNIFLTRSLMFKFVKS